MTKKKELTREQYQIIFDALNMSKAFAVYGDGREEHRQKVTEVEETLNSEYVEKFIPF